MENPVGWFEIYVNDLQRAKTFYESVFERTLENLDTPIKELEMWKFPSEMASPGCSGALVSMPGAPVGPGGTLIYFSSADCGVEESRVGQFGGKVYKSKMSIGPYGFITLAIDTEGNMFGIHSKNE